MQLKIPKEKTAEILLMNELKCMLACISVVTAEKIQGHKCTGCEELASGRKYRIYMECRNSKIHKSEKLACPKHSSAFVSDVDLCIFRMFGRTYKSSRSRKQRKKSHYFCIITAIFCFRKKCRSIKSLSIKRSKLQI